MQPKRNLLTVAVLLLLTALLGPGALTLPELLAVKATLFSVVGMEAVCLLRGYQSRMAYLPLALVLLIGVLTSQKAAPDSTRQRYFTFSPALMQGRYDQDLTDFSSAGCSGRYPNRQAYYHRYRVADGGLSYTTYDEPNSRRRSFGMEVLAGTERIGYRELDLNGPFLTSGETGYAKKSLFDLHLYTERDWVLGRTDQFGVSFRLGLHAGNLGYRARTAFDTTFTDRHMILAPDLMLRIGQRNRLFMQADMGRGVNGLGTIGSTLSLGSGFGQTHGSLAQAGVAFDEPYLGITQKTTLFVSGNVRLGGSGLWVEPYAATNFGRTHRLSLRLHYRLPVRESSR